LFKSSSLYLLINNFNKFNLVIFRLIFKLKSFIVNINILIKFYQIIFALKKNINFFLFNKINQGKISFSFVLFNTTNSMFYDIILYLFIFFLLIGIYRYVKSLKINVFSVHNFSLLDILHYLYSCRYILSAFIFIFYFINVINGLNIDIKEIYKIIDFLTKNGGFKNYILNINMNFDDNININFKHNNSSKTNKILAADNNNNLNSNNNGNNPNSNNNGNKANEVERSPSPINIDNLPVHMSPVVDGNGFSSSDDYYESSSDEGEFSERAHKIEEIKQERTAIKMDLFDLMMKRNNDIESMNSKLEKAEIIEETKTIIPENKPKADLKRTWDDRDSDSDSDNDKSNIANNQLNNESTSVKSKKAKFNNDNDKKEFQKLTNTIEKESKKLTRWIAEYNKKADMLEDLSSNYQGKVDRITKGINNINTNKNDKNDN